MQYRIQCMNASALRGLLVIVVAACVIAGCDSRSPAVSANTPTTADKPVPAPEQAPPEARLPHSQPTPKEQTAEPARRRSTPSPAPRQPTGKVQAQAEDRRQLGNPTSDRLTLSQGRAEAIERAVKEVDEAARNNAVNAAARLAELARNIDELRKLQGAAPTDAPAPKVSAPPSLDPAPAPATTTASAVYNAELAPQLYRDPSKPDRPVLRGGMATTLSFDIGPRSVTSVLPAKPAAAEIVGSSADVPLTVVLACGFCEPRAESLKRVLFRPSEGRSDKAQFEFTPQQRGGSGEYTGKLYISIINDQTGHEYDRLVLTVAVASVGVPAAGSRGHGTVLAPSTVVDSSDWRPDVILYANAQTERNVTISIQPVSTAMKELLGPLALNAENTARVFRSGIDDPELIDAMTNSAFGAMSAVSLQGELLKKLSATGIEAAVSPESQASLELSDAEASRVTAVIARSGQRLYRHLFSNSAETDLRKLIRQLEIAAANAPKNKPLRMMIVTDRLSLPWQYLHPVGSDVNADKFWGMQFSLSVRRVNNNATKKTLAGRTNDVRKVVFAQYGSSADPTVPLAKKQVAQLLKLPLAEGDLLRVDTGADLLAELSAQRKYIEGIVTFLHASAGSADTTPNLQFNDGDIVTSDTLEDLLNRVSAEEQDLRYLEGGPLVILNACETGPARNLPHVKLQNAMFQLGAKGVVVTEVSVWISLGHEVATQLIDQLAQGEAVSDALTAVRRKLLEQKKNPLGLLYVYYGDPAATLRR